LILVCGKSNHQAVATLEESVRRVIDERDRVEGGGGGRGKNFGLPTLVHFNKAMKLCVLDNGNMVLAQQVMQLLTQAEMAPDLITYNTQLDACAKSAPRRGHDAFVQGLSIFAQITSARLEPDLISYNCLLNIASKGAAATGNDKWTTNGLTVCVRVRVRTCVCVHECVCVNICIYLCTSFSLSLSLYVCKQIQKCIYMYIYIYIYIYIYFSLSLSLYI